MANTLNLGTVKTPGVYIDEMSLFPPSVAQVDTAIPAFIGPTRIAYQAGQPVRISSMAEFRSFYGGGPDRELTVSLDSRNSVQGVNVDATKSAYLYDSLLLYFSNGGEKCYIVSTGSYDSSHAGTAYTKALEALLKFDEPTLIVMPDAVRLSDGELATVQQDALKHCHTMQDRFAILDVKMDPTKRTPTTQKIKDTLTGFRTSVGNDYLNYGAAYYPYVETTLPLSVSFASLRLQKNGSSITPSQLLTEPAVTSLVATMAVIADDLKKVRDKMPSLLTYLDPDTTNKAYFIDTALSQFQSVVLSTEFDAEFDAYTADTAAPIVAIKAANTASDTDGAFAQLSTYVANFVSRVETRLQAQEQELIRKSPLYAGIVKAAATQGIIVPPSGAVAGAYARTDADRGVWKSPANVSLSYVAAPIVAITDSEQEGMNVDADAGKSINAVRAFTGKGTLVWGARTLAGSDNEWRYVAVRRFFLMAEESIKKATAQFVFEANDANTWVRVRAMIENFLTLQWRAGALAGVKAENAFFVRVGLGQTMTPQDVLNGFMIIEIGMAVVRPAEFIVLRFSHKMQEA